MGQIETLRLFPMTFDEFLRGIGHSMLIEAIRNAYAENTPLSSAAHESALNLYRTFLCLGGMSEMVSTYLDSGQDLIKVNRSLNKEIIAAYFKDMNKCVRNSTESHKVEQLYNSISNQMLNPSKKFQFDKINSNARTRDWSSALD
jgi:predicted AAA+ superfamily ATPase